MITQEEVFLNFPELDTPRMRLRKVSLADAEPMFAYSSDADVTRYLSYHHTNIGETIKKIERFEHQYTLGTCKLWALEWKETGEMIGAGGYRSWDTENNLAEIAYTVAKPYWGKGVATEATQAFIEFGFNTMDLNRIEARCVPGNTASEKVMQKCGMTLEGILRSQFYAKGVYYDVKMYAVLRNDIKGYFTGA